jgi:uncharacterized protein (AIM24 family)
MPIKLNTASGGGVILQGANTASDKTVTIPAADGNMLYSDASGNAQINSGYGSLATGYVARAWVNFNGTGTVAIRASGNVSSITDNGTGDYTVNFTTAMPDANYSGVATTGRNGGGTGLVVDAANAAVPTASAYRFYTLNTSFSPADSGYIFVAIFR